MAATNSTDDQKSQALETVKTFVSSLGRHDTLTEFIVPDAFDVHTTNSTGANQQLQLAHQTLFQYVADMDRKFDTTLGGDVVRIGIKVLDNNHQKVWTYDNLAAVWADTQFEILASRSPGVVWTAVNLFTLHKHGDTWKISGIGSKTLDPSQLDYEIRSDTPQVIRPVQALFDHLTNYNWDGLLSTLVARGTKGGATLFRPKNTATPSISLSLLAFVDRLKVVFVGQPNTKIEEKIMNCETREAVGPGFGFAWTPFQVEVDGVVSSTGLNVFTLYRVFDKDDGWRIAAIQDTSRPL